MEEYYSFSSPWSPSSYSSDCVSDCNSPVDLAIARPVGSSSGTQHNTSLCSLNKNDMLNTSEIVSGANQYLLPSTSLQCVHTSQCRGLSTDAARTESLYSTSLAEVSPTSHKPKFRLSPECNKKLKPTMSDRADSESLPTRTCLNRRRACFTRSNDNHKHARKRNRMSRIMTTLKQIDDRQREHAKFQLKLIDESL